MHITEIRNIILQELRMMGYKTNNGNTLHIYQKAEGKSIKDKCKLNDELYLELLPEGTFSKSMFVVDTYLIKDIKEEDLTALAVVIQSVCTDYEVGGF